MGEEAPGRHSTSGWAKQGRCGVFIYVSRFPEKPVWLETRGLLGTNPLSWHHIWSPWGTTPASTRGLARAGILSAGDPRRVET